MSPLFLTVPVQQGCRKSSRAFPRQDAERRWISLLGKAAGHPGLRQGKDITDRWRYGTHWGRRGTRNKRRERESEHEHPAAVRAEWMKSQGSNHRSKCLLLHGARLSPQTAVVQHSGNFLRKVPNLRHI